MIYYIRSYMLYIERMFKRHDCSVQNALILKTKTYHDFGLSFGSIKVQFTVKHYNLKIITSYLWCIHSKTCKVCLCLWGTCLWTVPKWLSFAAIIRNNTCALLKLICYWCMFSKHWPLFNDWSTSYNSWSEISHTDSATGVSSTAMRRNWFT